MMTSGLFLVNLYHMLHLLPLLLLSSGKGEFQAQLVTLLQVAGIWVRLLLFFNINPNLLVYLCQVILRSTSPG